MKKSINILLLIFATIWTITAQNPTSSVATTPYFCNFESAEDLQYWNLYNGNSHNRWCIGTATNNGGNKSLYISDDNGVSNAFNTHINAEYSYLSAWMYIDFTQGDYVISYDRKNQYPTNSVLIYIVPESYEIPDGQRIPYNYSIQSNWIPIDEFSSHTLEYKRSVSSFTISQTGRYKLLFYWQSGNYTGNSIQTPISIDNIHIQELTCDFPTYMEATNITDSTATLTWQASSATGWLLEYGKRPFIPGTGTTIYVENIMGNTTSSVVIPQLENNTIYDIHVKSICNGDTCPAPSIEITTALGAPATIPYHCDFETPSADLRSWQFVESDPSLLRWNIGNAINNGGERSMYISYDKGATHNIFDEGTYYRYAAREIYFPIAGQYYISYDWISESYNNLNDSYLRAALSPKNTTITPSTYFASYENIYNDWLSMDNNYSYGLVNSTEWKTNIQAFTIEEPGIYTLVFSWFNGYNCCHNNIIPPAIDNIHVDFVTCPLVRNLQTTNITSNSIALLWEQGDSENRWKIEYGPKNFTLGTGTTLNTTRVAQTLSNLNDNTEYDIYVYAICDDDNLSQYKKIIVKTLPAPITLPFVCDFEDENQNRSFTYSILPQENSWAIGNKVDAPNNALFISPDGGLSYGYDGDNSFYGNAHCWREVYLEQGVEYTFSFDWQNYTIDSLNDYFRVALIPYSEINNGYIPSIPHSTNSYNSLRFLPLDGGRALNGSNSWQNHTTTFRIPDHYYTHAILTFYWRDNGSADEEAIPAAIDNIEFHISDCPAPYPISETSTSNSITLQWQPAAQERQ